LTAREEGHAQQGLLWLFRVQTKWQGDRHGDHVCWLPPAERLAWAAGASCVVLPLELELIQARMKQKPLLWLEVSKSACVTT
jgi:hypothetical protein